MNDKPQDIVTKAEAEYWLDDQPNKRFADAAPELVRALVAEVKRLRGIEASA